MVIGFMIVSIAALILLAIGISCRKADEAVGFFTFVKPPRVEQVKDYNNAVSILWFAAAGIIEISAIPMLFLKQNSPFFLLLTVEAILLVIAMMIVYIKIEEKYKK